MKTAIGFTMVGLLFLGIVIGYKVYTPPPIDIGKLINIAYENATTTSALSEKQRCDKEGGKFKIDEKYKDNIEFIIGGADENQPQPIGYTLTCTQPEKELFREEI